jgi:predicted metalloprotease
MLGAGQSTQQAPTQTNAQEEEIKDFLAVVLGDTEQVWGTLFQQAGFRYQPPKLVLYRDATPTACGTGQAAAGPFYCPGDHKLYLDLSFLSELKRMGASGDFALAYVIAHEVGHHIQTLEGTAQKVQAARARSSKVAGNRIQVAMELQADCYAGVWAHHAQNQRQILEQGDLEEGMQAAASVGDDHLQRMAGRRVVPEGFTHGSSEQRQQWLLRGLKSGDLSQCDTFS